MRFYSSSAMLAFGVLSLSNLVAQNVILNGSFEDTAIILNNGNNLNVVVANWRITDSMATNPNPTNLVLPFSGYPGGPDVAQDGTIYFDGNGTDVRLFQDFQITEGQTVSYSAYFSRRDNLSVANATLKIFDSTGSTLLGESSPVNIASSASQEIWTQSQGSVFLTPGTYQMRIDLPNAANLDNVVLNVIPEPGTVALLGISGLALLLRCRRAKA